MAAEFFNFWNPQTYHVFMWVAESGRLDVERLVADTLAGPEGDGAARRDALAESLRDLMDELRAEANVPSDDGPGVRIGDVSQATDSLFTPILVEALRAIDFQAVATALLIRSGKWVPGKALPGIWRPEQAEGGPGDVT